MATKSSQINITELDFDSISDNLKAYLKGQEKLKDYNFEGSTMATLIDLLAYSSHIGAVLRRKFSATCWLYGVNAPWLERSMV